MKDMDLGIGGIRKFNTKDLIDLQLDSTSKGNQQKWYEKSEELYVKGQFIYQGKYWRDDLVEAVSSALGSQLPLQDKNVTVAKQELCEIQIGEVVLKGSFSKNFCKRGERYISFSRVTQLLGTEFPFTGTLEDKWYFVLNTMNTITKDDCTDYLIVMSILDYLVGNEDRHLNNFGLLAKHNSFRLVPLFDFGLGLFEHDRRYSGQSFRECLTLMECKPFDRNNQRVIDFIAANYELNRYLPDKFNLTNIELPSAKAGSYILNRVHYLKREVEGI